MQIDLISISLDVKGKPFDPNNFISQYIFSMFINDYTQLTIREPYGISLSSLSCFSQ